MGKLHEVLAVESGLKQAAQNVLQEAKHTFNDRKNHFVGQHRSYEKLHEQGIDHLPEHRDIVTTVAEKLEYVGDHLEKMLDAVGQKEFTNQKARADVILDDVVVMKDVPATLLLTLEGKLNDIRNTYLAIPTLDPGHTWNKDEGSKDVYISNKVEVLKTEKVVEPLVLAPATEKHPAQVDKISLDRPIGKWITQFTCGMITPIQKSNYLAKIDTLLRAVKKARMRANDTEAVNTKIGKVLVDYINS